MAHRNIVKAALVAGAILAWATPALAQGAPDDGTALKFTVPGTLFTAPVSNTAVVPDAPMAPAVVPGDFRPAKRGSVLSSGLLGLYASTAALQLLDVRSTYDVIARGGAEGNPFMAGLVAHPAAFAALKCSIAASTILAARQMAKHHKLAAVITMVAVNSVYATVVSHNFKLANELR